MAACQFLDKIDQINNLYDFLVILYEEIAPKEGAIIEEYEEQMDNEERRRLRKAVAQFLRGFKVDSVSSEDKKTIKNFILGYSGEVGPLLLALLKNIALLHHRSAPDETKTLESSSSFIVEKVEPLNSESFRTNYMVYPVRKSIYYELVSADNRPRSEEARSIGEPRMDIKVDNYLNSIDPISDSQGVLILKTCSLGDYKPNLLLLSDNKLNKHIERLKKKIRIASIPFANSTVTAAPINEQENEFFEFEVNPDGTRFSVSVKEEAILEEKVLYIIDSLADKGIDILLFPEFHLTKDVYERIQDYLREEEHDYLFVLPGSCWNERENRTFLLDRKGRELLTQKKLSLFDIN